MKIMFSFAQGAIFPIILSNCLFSLELLIPQKGKHKNTTFFSGPNEGRLFSELFFFRRKCLMCLFVYKINCIECNEFYIGMTKRRVHIRLKEHKTRHYSAVFKHIHEHNHNIDFEHPKILCNDSNKMRLLVKETLSIIGQSANKSLNVNVKSFECKLW